MRTSTSEISKLAGPTPPDDFQLATVVVTFAEKLRDNPYADGVDIDNLAEEADRIARALNNDDVDELANLIQRAADFS
jgi:Ca-activated chloride channel family protein